MRGLAVILIFVAVAAAPASFAATISSARQTITTGQAVLGSTPLIAGDILNFNTATGNEECLKESTLSISFNMSGAGSQTIRLSQPVPTMMYSPGSVFNLSGEYTLINTCPQTLSGNWQFLRNGQVLFSQAYSVPPATYCEMNFPDVVDLGSFSAERFNAKFSTDKTIAMSGQCPIGFSLTLTGTNSGDGNFLLGEDVKMSLSYNSPFGSVIRIVNGQPFSPATTGNLDIFLEKESDSSPAAGQKNASLLVRLNLI